MIIHVGMGRELRSMFAVFSTPLFTLVLDFLFLFIYLYILFIYLFMLARVYNMHV